MHGADQQRLAIYRVLDDDLVEAGHFDLYFDDSSHFGTRRNTLWVATVDVGTDGARTRVVRGRVTNGPAADPRYSKGCVRGSATYRLIDGKLARVKHEHHAHELHFEPARKPEE